MVAFGCGLCLSQPQNRRTGAVAALKLTLQAPLNSPEFAVSETEGPGEAGLCADQRGCAFHLSSP